VDPRVTVIIATYNRSEILPYSIGSVLRQTFSDFELLVVGDGCTDDSARVVESIGDPRVRWVNLPENTRHQSGPNNEGLRQARGEIIAYLGHDDLWLPHHLDAHVGVLTATGSDLAFSLCVNVDDAGKQWIIIPTPGRGSYSSPLGMTHLRRVTEEEGGWRDYRTMNIPPDVELWRRLHDAKRRFTFVPRLTGIKFPASIRRQVYVTRPNAEQSAWTTRIVNEPDLESTLMARWIAERQMPDAVPYRKLLVHVASELVIRARRRLRQSLSAYRNQRRGLGSGIETARKFKGL
jgi:glycosyltransferase involved in cell wall biosynthesis